MGNCLVFQNKEVIKIMQIDGKILKYQTPLRVHQALCEFPGYAISDALPVIRHLDPETEMRTGQLYYLLPPKTPIVETEYGTNIVRIKLVVSKQELKEMLMKGGISLDGMGSKLQREPSESDDSYRERCIGWKPALESIPEGSDFS